MTLVSRPEVEVVCGDAVGSCRCVLTAPHEGRAHECDSRVCTGSWDYDADGEFVVLRWANPGPRNPLYGLLRPWGPTMGEP